MLVNGPQPLLETLTPENIEVVVNAAQWAAGTYDVEPSARLNVGSIPPEDIRVLPTTIGVIITQAATPQSTPQQP